MSTPSKKENATERALPKKRGITVFEIVLFPMFAALMFVSKLIMEVLPNVHLLGMFVILLTVVFRARALIPIYIYVFLNGIYAGFSMWWFPYLYIWTILWGMTMLVPKKIPKPVACAVYPLLGALHGLAFGTLYSPAQAIMFGLDFEQTLAWIAVGFPFDVVHCVSNVFTCLLVVPFSGLLNKLWARAMRVRI